MAAPTPTLFRSALSNELSHIHTLSIPSVIAALTFLGLCNLFESASDDLDEGRRQFPSREYLGATATSICLWLFAILHKLEVIKDKKLRQSQLINWCVGLAVAAAFYAAISAIFDFTLWFFPASLFIYYEAMFVAVAVRRGFKHAKFALPLIVVPGISCCIAAILFYVYLSKRGEEVGGEVAVTVGSAVVYPIIRALLRNFFLSVVVKKINTQAESDTTGVEGRRTLTHNYGTLARALSMNFVTPGTAMLATLESFRTFAVGKAMEAVIELASTEAVLKLRKRGLVGGLKSSKVNPIAVMEQVGEEVVGQGEEEEEGEVEDEDERAVFSRNALEVRLAQEDVGEKAAAVVAVLAGMLSVSSFDDTRSFKWQEVVSRIAFTLLFEIVSDMVKFVRADAYGLRINRHNSEIGGLKTNTVGQLVLTSLCVSFSLYTGFALFHY
jgi:hypothetical protein